MSSQLMHPMFSSLRTVKKIRTGKPRTTNAIKHEKFMQTVTKGKKSSKEEKNKAFLQSYRDNMVVDRSNYVSNGMVGDSDSCAKKNIMTKMFNEKPEVQKEILAKAARTAPGWNKGGYMYITDGTDKTDVGRKK